MVSEAAASAAGNQAGSAHPPKLAVRDLAIAYGGQTVLEGVNLDVREHEIFGIIGPANAGKTSFLKCLNRMNDFNSNMRVVLTRYA